MLTERERARLRLELEQGSGLVFVRAERVDGRRALLDWLEAEFGAVGLVSPAASEDPWARIGEAAKGVAVVVVTGDELLRGQARDRWRQGLNTGRDALFELPAPVLFLVDGDTLDEFAQRAPDFWGRRGGVYEGAEAGWVLPSKAVAPSALRVSQPTGGEQGVGSSAVMASWAAIDAPLQTSPERFVDLGAVGWGASLSRVTAWLIGEHDEDFLVLKGPTGVGIRSLLWRARSSLKDDVWWVEVPRSESREPGLGTWEHVLGVRLLLAACVEPGWSSLEEELASFSPWLERLLPPDTRGAAAHAWKSAQKLGSTWREAQLAEALVPLHGEIADRAGALWGAAAARAAEAGLRPVMILESRRHGEVEPFIEGELRGWKTIAVGRWDGQTAVRNVHSRNVATEFVRPLLEGLEFPIGLLRSRLPTWLSVDEAAYELLAECAGGLPGLLLKLAKSGSLEPLSQALDSYGGFWFQPACLERQDVLSALRTELRGRRLRFEHVAILRTFMVAGADALTKCSTWERRSLFWDNHLLPNPTPGGPPILHPLTRYAITGELPK